MNFADSLVNSHPIFMKFDTLFSIHVSTALNISIFHKDAEVRPFGNEILRQS